MGKSTSDWNRKVDWNRIERQFRAGILSTHEIGREHKVPEATIRYQAKVRGWKRDLSNAVRASTRIKMVENLAKVFDGGKEAVDHLKKVTDEELIEEAAKTQVQVVREHQKTLGRGHQLTMRMLEELETTTTHKGELEDLIKTDIPAQRQRAMLAAVSLGARVTTLRDLATAARNWVSLERQAFSIADDKESNDPEKRKLDEMTADQLKQEILNDASSMGLELNAKDLQKGNGVALPRVNPNSNGKAH